MMKYLSPLSTRPPPPTPAALNPLSNQGGDLPEQYRAALFQALPAN